MSRLRRWLGEAVDGSGQWYLPHFEADDQYGFDPAVQSDWDQWMRLLPHGATSATTEHLEQALDLVRGQPFANAPRNRYDWADPVKETMIEAIAEAALELARRRLMEGRWRAAEQAAVAGLSVEPVMEQLWRMRILAAHSSGNHTGVREAVDRLLVIADRVGGDLEPETEELLQQLASDELPTRRSAAEL
jgi:DNA-binding SARP family transcriptional activator